MKNKIFKKTDTFLLLVTCCLAAGCSNPIEKFVEHRVVLASGIDFDNRKLVLVNAETGEAVIPCDPIPDQKSETASTKGKTKNVDNDANVSIKKCEAQFMFSEENPALNSAIELSKQPI